MSDAMDHDVREVIRRRIELRERDGHERLLLNHIDLRALLDAADERDRLAAQVERVRALADGWQSRGEHMMAYSKTPEVPGDMADALLDGGAEFVERARLVRNALDDQGAGS